MNPRILIAAPASGSGKTLITCGILQALVNRGLKVSSFKCGPDYIDPMFHSRVIGTPSKNLDPFFTDRDMMTYLFQRSAGEDISVIEGVMGFYDGSPIGDTSGSTYDVSERLETPVILVVNSKGASLSTMALLKGFLDFRKNNIRGVIYNNMSETVYRTISRMTEEEFGIKCIGYVPKVSHLVLESRHLGLCLPGEIDALKDKLNQLAELLETTLDMDTLIDIAGTAPDLEVKVPKMKRIKGKARIAVASDETFCFTYEDNLRSLEECGAELVYFSPMHDPALPKDIDGLILSGGYPELHAKELSSNISMRNDILEHLKNGLPLMAECGGFMYLNKSITDPDGVVYPMVGYYDADAENKGKLNRFGYITVTSKGGSDIFGDSAVKAHEFHYWDSTDYGNDCKAVKTSGKEYDCAFCKGPQYAGYPHLYLYSQPDVAYNFVKACEGFRLSRE